MFLVQHQSLNLLISSPACYHCTTAAPRVTKEINTVHNTLFLTSSYTVQPVKQPATAWWCRPRALLYSPHSPGYSQHQPLLPPASIAWCVPGGPAERHRGWAQQNSVMSPVRAVVCYGDDRDLPWGERKKCLMTIAMNMDICVIYYVISKSVIVSKCECWALY